MLSGRPGRRLRVPNAMRDDNSHVPCGRSGKVHHNEGKSNMKRLFAVICAGVLLLESCQDLGTPYAGSFLGTFSFRSFDSLLDEIHEKAAAQPLTSCRSIDSAALPSATSPKGAYGLPRSPLPAVCRNTNPKAAGRHRT